MDNAIIIIDPQAAIQEAVSRKQIVIGMQTNRTLVDGIDFGTIPGGSKPTLLKPGAEKLCAALGLDPRFDVTDRVQVWNPDAPLFHYEFRCSLIHIATGREIATGIGSCNSMESKYRWRKAERVCSQCGKSAIIKGKQEYGGGWVCFKKKGGCGAKFTDNDPAIVDQPDGNVPNEDVFSLVNTISKMAQKRALIAAVLIGANASEFFTQDMEDFANYAAANVDTETGEIIDAHVEEIPATTKAPTVSIATPPQKATAPRNAQTRHIDAAKVGIVNGTPLIKLYDSLASESAQAAEAVYVRGIGAMARLSDGGSLSVDMARVGEEQILVPADSGDQILITVTPDKPLGTLNLWTVTGAEWNDSVKAAS